MGRPRKDGTAAQPRKPRDKVAELTFSAMAFLKALEGATAAIQGKLTSETAPGYRALVEALKGASSASDMLCASFAAQLEVIEREAALIAQNAAYAAEIERLRNALLTAGHSDKVGESPIKRGKPIPPKRPEIAPLTAA